VLGKVCLQLDQRRVAFVSVDIHAENPEKPVPLIM
jgi:hypothetical protein